VQRKKIRRSFDALGASNQEIMCAEFLRLPIVKRFRMPQLVCLLRDVGRTMKDLDLVGVAKDGRRIFGQVTYYRDDSKEFYEKRTKLQKFKGHKGAHLILFCDSERSRTGDGMTVLSIREVYPIF
jgi:hypothetical protein